MPPQIGNFRHRITLQSVTESQDSTGGMVQTWSDFAKNISASMLPMSGKEYFEAVQVQSSITTKIMIRWRDGVTAQMRVKHITNELASPQTYDIYSIEAVLPDATGRAFITLMCTKRDSEGYRSDGV